MYQALPDLAYGEDKNDYIRRCMQWAHGNGEPQLATIELASVKWQAWEIERLIIEIEEGSQDALRSAVVMLLKRNYLP